MTSNKSIRRKGKAHWKGTLEQGNGLLGVESGAFEAPYGFRSRFESGPGTNPEELIGAAHAGCFSKALSLALSKAGFTPRGIDTGATVHLERRESGFTITRIELDTTVDAPGLEQRTLAELAGQAKRECPVSRLLAGGAEISVRAALR